MKKTKTKKTGIEGALSTEATAGDWNRIRDDLVARADREGLIDVAYEMHDSPFGPLLVGATETGLVRVGLSAESEDEVLEDLARRLSPRIVRTSRPQITVTRGQLDEYFAGERRDFDLELDWQLTRGFRRQILQATDHIPYGETRSYTDLAVEAGSPRAVRAAGTALATNPLPIVVPCHRVLRSDGKVGSYLGGSSMKETLLDMERTGS